MPKPTKTNRSISVASRTLGMLRFVLFLVALTGVFLYTRVSAPTHVSAATSSYLNFQARLLSSTGSLVPDGTYNVEFKLYDSLAAGASAQGVCVGGGTDDCLWVETRTAGNKVTVKNGYLSVYLGQVTALPNINWDQDIWLTMNIGGSGAPTWDGEMTPRLKLTAVPYAMSAGQLAKASGANTGSLQFGTIANNPVITLPDATGTVALLQGAQTFTGVITLSSAGTALSVTNDATIGGTLSLNGNATIGNATADRLTVTSQILGATPLVFQGATDNGFATSFTFTEPTANNTITFPNASGTVQLAPASGNYLFQVPTSTAANTVTPTAASAVGLTVNATSGTSAVAAIFNQAHNTSPADTVQINTTNTAGTQVNGLSVSRNGAGGTTTNLLNLTNTAGTATNAITIAGTFTNLINSTNLTVTNAGNADFAGTLTAGTSNAFTVAAGGNITVAATTGTGISFNNTGLVTDISLQNGETIDNNADGTILLTAATTSFTGDLVVQGRTTQFSNYKPEYRWRFGGGTDLNWKKIADITIGVGAFQAASFQVDLLDANGNYGQTSNAIPMRYYVSANRSGAVQDDADNGTISGPNTDYVRLVKTALGVYELQVRQTVNYKHLEVAARLISDNGGATVTYATTPVDGSTTGTFYTPSTTGYTQTFANLTAAGLLQGTGGLTVTGATSINTTGTANTSIGNNTGTFQLLSSGVDITTAGAVSGVTTLGLSGAITGATATNTINGLIINAGALSGITGYSQTSGTFALSGGGNFSIDSAAFDVTTAGAVSGVTTLNASGLIQGTGGLTITGATSLAATAISSTLGVTGTSTLGVVNSGAITTSGNFVQSGATTFSTGTGAISLNGATTVTNNGSAFTMQGWSAATDADIDSLMPGSTSGALIEAPVNAHFVLGLRENDSGDGFAIVSGNGNYSVDGVYDKTVFYAASTGNIGFGTSAPSAALTFDEGADRTINVLTRTTNAAGNALTIIGGAGGAGASAFTGGTLTLQGGAAGGTGSANGANVVIQGGNGVGTGVPGVVSIDTPVFTASATQAYAANTTIAQAIIDGNSTVPVNATAASLTITVPAPTITSVGRIVYITAIAGSNSFTLTPTGGTSFTMAANTTATLVWNGTTWTNAGVDGGSSSYIQNQSASDQTGNFRINGTGRANTSFLTPTIDTATAVTLNIGNTTASAITIGRTGVTTTNAGALTVTQVLTANGGITIPIAKTVGYSSAHNTLADVYAYAEKGDKIRFAAPFKVEYFDTGTSLWTTWASPPEFRYATDGQGSTVVPSIDFAHKLFRLTYSGLGCSAASNAIIEQTYLERALILTAETSTDDITYTTRNSSAFSAAGQMVFATGAPTCSENYIRLVFDTTMIAGDTFRLSTLSLITTRPGDQGGTGLSAMLPIKWDYLQNVGIGGAANASYKLNVQGDINTSSSIYTGNTARLSNAGVLSSITGYTQSSGNFGISGTGTFGTGTGAISLNGATSVTGTNTLTVGTGATSLGGTLAVTGNTTLTGTLTVNGSQFTNNGSTLNTAQAVANLPTGGAIGTAAATVDVDTTFTVNQTTAGQTLSLPNPTTATAGRIAYVANIGTTPFTMHGVTIVNGNAQTYIWNGTAWTATNVDGAGSGVTSIGAIDTQTKSANGAVISGNQLFLQTADATNVGLVSIGAQTFAGVKTFNAAGTALLVTNNATIGGVLTTTGVNYNSNYKTYERSYTVNTATPATLLDDTGVAFSATKSYEVKAVITATGTQTGATGYFYGDGTVFTLAKTYEAGTSSNHIEFYLDAGVPKVRLYAHASLYTVSVLVTEVVNKGRVLGPQYLLYGDGNASLTTNGAFTSAGLLQGNLGLTVTGAAVNLNVSSNFATNINTGTSTGAVTVGNNAAGAISLQSGSAISIGNNAIAQTITIGNTTGATSINLQSGTGGILIPASLAGTVNTSTYLCRNSSNQLTTCLTTGTGAAFVQGGNDFGANAILGTNGAGQTLSFETAGTTRATLDATGNLSFAQATTISTSLLNSALTVNANGTGTLTLDTTGAGTVTLAQNATTVNLATSATATTIGLGNTTGATALNLNVGTGNFTLNGVGASTYTLGAATTTGTITIGGTAQTGNLTLGSSTGTNSVLIANGSGASTVNIANVQVGGAVNIGAGMTTGTITIGGTGLQTGTIGLGIGTGAQTINLGTGGTGAKTVTLGSTASTSSLTLQSGTGNLNITTQGTGSLNIGNNAAAQTINIGNATGATAVSILCGTGTCGFGNNATDHSTTVGSTTGVSATTLQAGTGNLTFNAAQAQFSEVTGTRTLTVQTRTTNVAGSNLTIAGGTAGAGASAFTGGTLTIQGGNAGGTGNANGANVVIQGGAGVGTGVPGVVSIDTPVFTASSTQAYGVNTTIAQAIVDGNSTVPVNATAAGLTITVPAPTITTVGRIIYITAITGSNSFTLAPTGGTSFTMAANTTATLVWNGTVWTNAGVDGGSSSYIQNQSNTNQTGNFRITGTGRANTSFISPLYTSLDSQGAANSDNVILQSGNAASGNGNSSGTVTIKSGDATNGSNGSSGNITIDNGVKLGSGTAGNISIGTVNSSAITIGRAGITTTNGGILAVTGTSTFTGALTANGGISCSDCIALGTETSGNYALGDAEGGAALNLAREDNRVISPSELAAGQLKFGFTSFNNDNTSPYADFLHFRSYTDASGGSDNLVVFRKDQIGMRIYQQAFGSATAYSSYKDVALQTDNVIFGTVTGTTINATTGINTGAGAGTQRIDASGNLVNIGTISSGAITTSGNFSQTGATTFSTGSGANTLNGATTLSSTLAVTGSSTFNNSVTISGSNTLTVGTGATSLGGTLGVTGAITGSSTIQGTRLISTIATGTSPLQVTSTTLVNNLNAELLGGYTESQIGASLRSGYMVSGGGTVGYNTTGTGVSWTTRFIVISNSKGADFGTSGYFDINMPADTTVITGANTSNITVTGGAIPLPAWCALYYILPIGSANTSLPANFRVVCYSGSNFSIPSNWLLIASHNSDNATMRFGNGLVLRSGQSGTAGSVNNVTFNTSVTSPILVSTVATGTAPLTVTSTTKVTNLNADLLDGLDSTDFAPISGGSGYVQLQGATPGTAQTGHLNITGTGIIPTIRFGGSRGELSGGGTGDPTIQMLTGASWFNIRNIAGTDVVRVLDNGNITATGTINSQTISSTANFTGTLGVATSITSPFYNVTAATGNGICFWQDCSNYKIHMGTGAEYVYGPVTGYSIKSNMNNDTTRGWTWGVTGVAPVAAINTQGNMQLAGNLVAMGNLGVGIASPAAKLDVRDGAIVNSNSTTSHYRNVTSYNYSGGAINGALKITMPSTRSWSNTMLSFTIRGYDYSANGEWEVRVSGYNYSGTPQWINYNAQIIGSAPFTKVRLAHDGTSNIIILGDVTDAGIPTTATAWSYPKVWVTDVIAGHTNMDGWGTGWGTSLITTLTGVTNSVTPGIPQYTTSAGNFGIGTTAPAAMLSVGSTSQFQVSSAGAVTSTSTIQGTQLISTVATGTAPLSVTSTTLVTNLNADLLDGAQASMVAGNSTIVQRNASGYVYANYFNTTADITATAATHFAIQTGSDNFIRWQTPANVRTSLGLTSGGAGDIWVDEAGDTMTGALSITAAGTGLAVTNNATIGTLRVGATAAVSNALITAVANGNSFEFGHTNSAGYRSTLGAQSSDGAPFVAFNAEAGTTANTYRTRGVAGSILKSNLAGGFLFGNAPTATADNQAFVQSASLTSAGTLTVAADLVASGGDLTLSGVSTITGGGSQATYGALSINGTGGGYSGINFRSGATNYGTLMVHPDYQGFFNNTDNGWDWYFTNGVLTAGTIPAANVAAGTFGAGNFIFPDNLTVNDITTLSGEVNATGGSGTAYNTAPIEIATTLTPRIAFHWPGVVASQLGMDSAGIIRTFDNPGTGYATFAAANYYVAGTQIVDTSRNMSNIGTISSGAITSTGYSSFGALRINGADASNTIWQNNANTNLAITANGGDIVMGQTSTTTQFVLKANGNLGIGVASPQAKLHVVGGTYLNGDLGITGMSGVQSQANNFNLAPNSSFEVKTNAAGNDPDGWTSAAVPGNGTATVTRASDSQADGTYAMKLANTGTTSYTLFTMNSYIPVKPSTQYISTIDIRHDTVASTCSGSVYVRVYWYTSTLAAASTQYLDSVGAGTTTTSWATYGGGVVLTSPSNATFAKLEYYNFQNAGSCTRWYDNAVFRQVDFTGNVGFSGRVNTSTGYQVAGAATAGTYLRGDGTNFVQSAILAGDLPSGSGNYIQNQTTLQSSSNFHISGNGVAMGNLSINTTSTAGKLTALSTSVVPAGYFTGNTTAGSSNGIYVSAGTNSSDYALWVQSRGLADYLMVRGDGNVGIGIASPGYKLDVAGDINMTGVLRVSGEPVLTTTSSVFTNLQDPTDQAGRVEIGGLTNNSNSYYNSAHYFHGRVGSGLTFATMNATGLGVGVAPSEKLTVAGNVLINSTNSLLFGSGSSNGAILSTSAGTLNMRTGSTQLNIDNNAGAANLISIANTGATTINSSAGGGIIGLTVNVSAQATPLKLKSTYTDSGTLAFQMGTFTNTENSIISLNSAENASKNFSIVGYGLGNISQFRVGATNSQFDGNVTTSGYASITGASDASGNLRFSAANPYISASSYITMPGGLFVSGGTLYTTNQIQARGGIGNDSAAALTIAGGTSGYTNVSGSLGVGTATPNFKFSTVGTVSGGNVAAITNLTTTDGATTSVLRLNLGTATSGSASRWMQFCAAATADNSATCLGKIRMNTGNVAYESGGGDFAEYVDMIEGSGEGDIVSTGANGNHLAREGESVLGIVSNTAAFIGNSKSEEPNPNQALVGFVGQVKVKVSTINGVIRLGDPIGASEIPGRGAKAVAKGFIAGTALEAFDPASGKGVAAVCPVGTDPDVICGYIMVKLQPTYFDPTVEQLIQGESAAFSTLNVDGEATIQNLTVKGATDTKDLTVTGIAIIQNLTVVQEATIGDLKVTGIATIEKLVVKDIEVTGSLTVKGGISTAIANKTANYAVTLSDSIITADASQDENFTVTLPTAVGIAGRQFTIKKIDNSTNKALIKTTGVLSADGLTTVYQTIDGAETYTLNTQYKYVVVVSDGTNWIIVGNN